MQNSADIKIHKRANSPVNLVIVTKILSQDIQRDKKFYSKTKAKLQRSSRSRIFEFVSQKPESQSYIEKLISREFSNFLKRESKAKKKILSFYRSFIIGLVVHRKKFTSLHQELNECRIFSRGLFFCHRSDANSLFTVARIAIPTWNSDHRTNHILIIDNTGLQNFSQKCPLFGF